METDYSHYAVLHEAHHSEEEPSTALQLLSALGVGTWLLGRDGGTSGGQGLGSPYHYPGPPGAPPHVHHLGN